MCSRPPAAEMVGQALEGLRVLVVEDELLISLLIEDILADRHCAVIGPFDRLAGALQAAKAEAFDLAVLDVNVAGEKVYPVAEILAARCIPFLFLSGYGQAAVPKNRPEWRVCKKPFRLEDLVTMLEAQMDRA